MSSSRSSHSDPVTPGAQPTISVTDDYVVEVWEGAKQSALCYRRNVTLDDLRATYLAFQALDRAIEQRHGSLEDPLGREIASIGSFMTNVLDLARQLHEAQEQALGVSSRQRHETTDTFEQFKFGAWLHLTQLTLRSALPLPRWRPTEMFCLSGPLPVPSSRNSVAAQHGYAEPRDVEHLAELTKTLCQSLAVHFAAQRGAQYEPDYRSSGIYQNLLDAVDRTLDNYGVLHGVTLTLQDLAWTSEQRNNNPELQDSRTVINHKDDSIAEEAFIGCRLVLSAQESMLNDLNVLSLEPDLDIDPHLLAYVNLQSQILSNAWDSFKNVVEQIRSIVRGGEEERSAARRRLWLLESGSTEE